MTKKLLTFLTLLMLFYGVGWADTQTLTFWNKGNGNVTSLGPTTVGFFTITCTNTNFAGNSNTYATVSTNGTITIETTGYKITGLNIGVTSTSYPLNSATFTNGTSSIGTYSYNSETGGGEWTYTNGTNKIVITNTANKACRLKTIIITYETDGGSATTYAITCNSNNTEYGTISASPNPAAETATVTITPSPAAGYQLATLTAYKTGDSSTPVTISNNQFTMPAYPVTVDATFEAKPTYGITVTNGTASLASAYEGQTVTLTPTIPSGKVVDWTNTTVTPSSVTINQSNYTFSMPDEAVTVVFAFKDDPVANAATATFDATVDTGESPLYKDPVTFTCSSGALDNGTEYRLYKNGTTTFSVPTGYKIVKIEFAGSSSYSSYSPSGFTVTDGNYAYSGLNGVWTGEAESVSFTATENQVRCTLITVYYTAPVEDGYYLVGVNGNWTPSNSYKFTSKTDGTYTLDVESLPANTEFKIVKVDNGTNTWYGGQSNDYFGITSSVHNNVDMSGTANYKIEGAGDYFFTISSDMKLTVQKAPIVIKGTFDWTNGVEMTKTDDGWTVSLDDTFAVGNEFGFTDGWGGWHGGAGAWVLEDYLGTALDMGTDGNYVVRVEGKYTISVNRALNKMTAILTPVAHAINCSVVTDPVDKTGGTLEADKETAVAGETVTLTITTNNGYTLNSVTVNDEAITPNEGVYSFTMPNADANVVANFSANSYAITVVSPNGTTTCPSTATTGQAVSFTVTPDENYTVSSVTATANTGSSTFAVTVTEENGTYSFGMPPYPVTVTVTYTQQSSGGGSGEWTLVTDATTLDTNSEYIIVNQGAGMAMSTTQNDHNRPAIAIELSNDYSTANPSDGTQIFTLEGNSSGWYFNTGSGYIYAASSGSNYLQTEEEKDDNAKATISISGGEATIVFQGTNSRNNLRYNPNNSNPIFSCYASTSNMSKVSLYVRSQATVKAPTISPEGGTFLNSLYPNGITVTVTPVTQGSTIHVSTDGTNYTESTDAITITVTETTTVTAYASKDGEDSESVSETYNFVDVILEDVQFSPIPGTYSGAQTLQMYTTNQNAKIYYTTDGSTPSATNGTLYSSSDTINLAVGNTYNFKAIAVLGNNTSDVAEGTYVINAASSSALNSIAELNSSYTDVTATMGNPFQIIYMNTWRNDGYTPEYAYVRDNTGYGLIYFGNNYYRDANYSTRYSVPGALVCEMGDWVPGGIATGTVKVWSDGFHNELGGSNYKETITSWPTSTSQLAGNTPIIPEEMTNANINAGWDISNTFADAFNAAFVHYCDSLNLNVNNLTDNQKNAANAYAIQKVGGYSSHIQPNNVWGHYVHLRKNTIQVTNAKNAANATPDGEGDLKRHKYSGFVTDQSGEQTIYYDGFYLFSGYNGSDDLSNEYFEGIQNNGGTFDVYGIVGFYGPYAASEEWHYIPFEIIPIDFLYIYKPIINIDNVAYSDHEPITEYETQTVTLTCATEGATIWYKTSEMEDFVEYTEPFTVDATTTIETYSSIPTKYNDLMESVVNTLVINIGSVPQPIISPESGVYVLGVDDEDATIAFDANATVPTGTIIYFTVNGSDPSDVNSARYEYTTANIAEYLTGIDETTTVRAIAYAEVTNDGATRGYYSREAEARTYTFVKSNGIIYNLVTDQTQLNESSVYVVVNKANNMAISTTQNANNRDAAGVKFVDEATKAQVYGNDDLAQFTLKKVGNKWYIQTTNSSENGYLYVGNGNTLLTTGTAIDAAEATINIDADAEHQAHISFVYDNEVTRYLRYWLGGQAFSTYTSETSNLPVSLYYIVATPLANIEKEGVSGKQYTVADELIAVHCVVKGDYAYLWCKDQGNVSISKTEAKTINNVEQIDYMRDVLKAQSGDWDQSNWVMLKFKPSSNNLTSVTGAVNHYLKPATITGTYTDDLNFTITMPDGDGEGLPSGALGNAVTYTKNEFCTANYLDANLNLTDESTGAHSEVNGKYYFFMNPKIQEVAHITFAVWNGTYFEIPAKDNAGNNSADLKGAFTVDWTYNASGDVHSELQTGVKYQFLAVLNTATSPVTLRNVNADGSKKVMPLDLTGGNENIITAVTDVTGKAVAGVKYYNLAGMASDKPFDGVNIIVTTYTDGSRSSQKVLQ